MYYLILALIGLVMGLFGGLLGIGGSVVMIPAMVLVFGVGGGEKQHLYQASAMICNFFVAASVTFVHQKAKVLMFGVVKLLVPSAMVGVILGVLLSNTSFFAGGRSWLLTRVFGGFMVYIVIYNCVKLFGKNEKRGDLDTSNVRHSVPLTVLNGLITGIGAGLLGLGGGSICVPLQQLMLKMPLKRAIINSAATIILIAVVGAALKNATLGEHNIAIVESVRIAIVVIPTAIIGGLAGGRLMHILPENIVRIAFVILMLAASYKMLTAAPSL